MERLSKIMWFAVFGVVLVTVTHLTSCGGSPQSTPSPARLTVGLVSYDDGPKDLEKYQRFQNYLAEQLNAVVELEPVFNEIRALEQIQSKRWSLVFAPSGLAAIAIAEAQYIPLFPMQGTTNQKSVLVVRQDSSLASLKDLQDKSVALGEVGSATGYYLPLYDLYGLTLKSIQFAPTPKDVLTWVANQEVAAGALSEEQFQGHRLDFDYDTFRILHQSRAVPPGAVLLSPMVERNQQQFIEKAMASAPSTITADAAYVPNSPPPDLSQLIELVEKVRPLESRIKEAPAILTIDTLATEESAAGE
jgi:phosphonate transport system substrate-binding protein